MAEDVDNLKKELGDCQKKSEEYLAGWQRARADFLNYKKEEMERIAEFLKYGSEEMILKVLPILDNFEVAEKKINEELGKDENPAPEPSVRYGASIKGLLQIKKQLLDFLKNYGVEEIKSVGEKFDPNLHEVVEEVAENGPPQTIVEEVQRGYKINGRLLRPAKVKVAK